MNAMEVLLSVRTQVVSLALAVNLAVLAPPSVALSVGDGKPIRIVAFGDSLTAGYMLKPKDAFPAQLERALETRGHSVEIANAGVSGETTAQGLERLDWAVPSETEAVILELGANDALRGIDPKTTRANLDAIMSKLEARNIEILLAGMLAPKNWGPAYEAEYNALFKDLAAKHGAVHYPFFLDGVAMNASLTLSDGLHPSEKGVGIIVERIMPAVEELIARVEAKRLVAASGDAAR